MTSRKARTMFGWKLMLLWLCLAPSVVSSQTTSGDALSAASSTAYGNCAAPTTPGVRVCQPVVFGGSSEIASPLQVIASGTGSGGPVKYMQLWIDGVKVKQANGNVFDAPITLSDGTHRLVVVESDTTGAFRKSSPITLQIQGSTANESCPPPSGAGVNVCQPATVNSCHTAGWTTIIASGTGASGSVRRMEMWSNGVKLAIFPGNRINTNLFLTDFSKVTIVEVDSSGAYIKSPAYVIQSC